MRNEQARLPKADATSAHAAGTAAGSRRGIAILGARLSVLPLRPRDKRPLIRWDMFQTALPSTSDVTGWFHRWLDANLGIVTGALSKLIVVDVDPRHGRDDSLGAFERRFGKKPATVESRTGGGGRHFYFAYPGYPVQNRAGIGQGIDLRGDGGYVAPPSIHPSGGPYVRLPAQSPRGARTSTDAALAGYRNWRALRTGRSVGDWRKRAYPEGQRNSTIASLTGHLLWHGVDETVALELMLAWNRERCRPPVDDAEVAQVVRNIGRLHEQHVA
jgi:hypothetical protein